MMASQLPERAHLMRGLSGTGWFVIFTVLAALHCMPWIMPQYVHIMIMTFLFAAMGQGWNILGGYAGQFSFGHSIFFGLGAYTSTLLYIHAGVSPWIGMVCASAMGIVLGLSIGFLSFRYGLRGPFFALIMLAFAEIFHMIAMGWSAVGASQGLLIPLKGSSVLAMQFIRKEPFYFMALWMMVGTIYLAWRLERTRTGLYFLAVREDHDAAEALGVDTFRAQMIAMALSGGVTSMAGTVYAQYLLYIDPDSTFGLLNSVEIMVRPIIGGPGTVFGPLLGSAVLTPLAEVTRLAFQSYSGVYLMWYGLILMVVIIFLPKGLMGLVHQVTEKTRGRGKRNHG
jgi:branched-chain amino acid transport system permease protein